MDEFELSDPNVEFTALVTALQEFGGIVERSDTFWAERIQHAVQWDPTQGVVTERPKTVSSKDPSDSLDASTSSEETVMKHFDPRQAPLPIELVPLCNLYDRHILRQKVVIQLSLPTSDRIKMRSSSGDTAMERVDQIHLWHLKHQSEDGEETRKQPEFSLAVDVGEEDIVLVSDDESAEGMPRTGEFGYARLQADLGCWCRVYKQKSHSVLISTTMQSFTFVLAMSCH